MVLGRDGEEVLNDNSKRSLELRFENDLIITDDKFGHNNKHKFTMGKFSKSEILIH